jgi:hypothetical protein
MERGEPEESFRHQAISLSHAASSRLESSALLCSALLCSALLTTRIEQRRSAAATHYTPPNTVNYIY